MAWIIAVAAFAVLLILAIDNPIWVTVQFLFWQSQLPLVGLVLLAAALGGVVVGAWWAVRGFRNFRRRRQDQERIHQLESELAKAQEQVRYLEQEVQRREVERVEAVRAAADAEAGRAEAERAAAARAENQRAETLRTELTTAKLPDGEPGGAE